MQTEGGWLLNGVKSFGCATGVADEYLVTAKAAEIADLSRAEFLAALNSFGITPFQYDSANDLLEEIARV